MAKKRPTDVPEIPSLDDCLEVAITEAQKKYPTQLYTGSEETMRSICLKVPSLAIRYVFQQEGLPLGRFYLLDGVKESCKSAMSYEVVRWTRVQQGSGMVIEVEDKRSPELADSILEYDPKALIVQRTVTQEEWHTVLTEWVSKLRSIMDGTDKKKGIGRTRPFTFIVDSIMAAQVEAVYTKIAEEGHTSARYALEAKGLSDYLKFITKELSDMPLIIVGINHIKEKPREGQGMVGTMRNMPGGKAPEYHASIDIEMKRIGSQKRTANGNEFISLGMATKKNSMAPHADIEVDMVWNFDVDKPTASGEYLQRTWFDWPRATFEMLQKVEANSGQERKKKLNELFRFEWKKGQNQLWSRDLDVTKENPVTIEQAHILLETKLEEEPEFRKLLYALLGVRCRPIFQPGVDLRKQMIEVRELSKTLQADRVRYIQECQVPFVPAVPTIPRTTPVVDDFDSPVLEFGGEDTGTLN